MKTFELDIIIDEGEKSYQKKIKIMSESKEELAQKLNALKVLSESMNHEDFIVTVELIKEKPELIPVVKELITEGEELSESQLMVRLPKYVKKVLTVLKS